MSLISLISPRALLKIKFTYIAKESLNYISFPSNLFSRSVLSLHKEPGFLGRIFLFGKLLILSGYKATSFFRVYAMGSIAMYEDGGALLIFFNLF